MAEIIVRSQLFNNNHEGEGTRADVAVVVGFVRVWTCGGRIRESEGKEDDVGVFETVSVRQ